MASAIEKFLAVAEAEVGYLEKKSNSQLDSKTANAGSNNFTKYGAWYGMNGQPWCDMFVSWCAAQAGVLDIIGKFAYVPSHQNFFDNKGKYYARDKITPKRGDIVFFKNESHIGIVKGVSGSYVKTIEGNTSGGSTLVANGGGVFEKSYPLTSSYIQGYGVPDYSATVDLSGATSVNYTGTVKANGGLNCRTYPVDGSIVKTYANGSKVTITKELDGWGYTGEGWVSLQYVVKDQEPAQEPEKPTITEEDDDMDVTKLTDDQVLYLANRIQETLGKQEPAQWSETDRKWAEENGVIIGDENGKMLYKSYTTREQMVTFLHRVANLLK